MRPQLFDLRGLTINQPMASAISDGPKRVENRPWTTRAVRSLTGLWIAVHAGKRLYSGTWDRQAMILAGWTDMPEVEDMPRSAILGIARVTDIVPYSVGDPRLDNPWANGPYCWLLDDVIKLAEPIGCSGMLGLWRVQKPVVERIREQIAG